MKKIFILIMFFCVNIIFSVDIQYAIEHEYKVKFIDNKDYSYLPKCKIVEFNNLKIRYVNKDYKDSNIDSDDWYSAESIKNFYNKVVINESYSYGFGSDTKVYKIKDEYIVDYLVLGMFEVEDFRFERFIIVFSTTNAQIFQITNRGDFTQYQDELVRGKYLMHRDNIPKNRLIWDYKNRAEENVVEKMRSNKLELKKFQELYNDSQKVFELIKVCV